MLFEASFDIKFLKSFTRLATNETNLSYVRLFLLVLLSQSTKLVDNNTSKNIYHDNRKDDI